MIEPQARQTGKTTVTMTLTKDAFLVSLVRARRASSSRLYRSLSHRAKVNYMRRVRAKRKSSEKSFLHK